jgi:hypothetical protein
MERYSDQRGPYDKRGLSPAINGLGAAGTHGPEGQAAFSCGRPLSAAPTALAAERGSGA